MNKKKLFIITLAAVLLLSAFTFAAAALAEGDETPPPFISGLLDPADGKKKKPTATPGLGLLTPSPTPKPTPEPTEYPFEPSLREDHEGHTVTSKANAVDETKHTVNKYCEDCQQYFGEETTEPHTFNTQGTCSLCGYACTHNWEHDSYKNDGNTEMHMDVQVCSVCGAKTEKRAAHKPMHLSWESVSDTHDRETVRCNMCELTYTFAPAAHTFAAVSYETNGTANHTKYTQCSKCGARQTGSGKTEGHTYIKGWCNCEYCDQPANHEHDINYKWRCSYRPLNAEQHIVYYACNAIGCGAFLPADPAPHTFDPVTLKCTVCGYLKEGCAHHYTYAPGGSGITAKQHTLIGTCTNCGKQITVTGEHKMQVVSTECVPSDDSLHTRTVTERCSVCGYEKQHTETEKHSFVCTPDGSAHACPACGKTAEHGYSFVERKNDKGWIGHSCVYRCNDCAHQKEEIESHDLVKRYEQRNSEWHAHVTECTLCGIFTSGSAKHVFDESGVCVCGYKKAE